MAEARNELVASHVNECAECQRLEKVLEPAEAALAMSTGELSDAARARMWKAIEQPQPNPLRLRVPGAVLLAAAAALLLLIWARPGQESKPRPPTAVRPELIETKAGARRWTAPGVNLVLAEQTTILLQEHSERVLLQLRRGSVDAEVSLEDARSLIIATPFARIRSVGGRFSASLSLDRVDVTVQTGTLTVNRQGEILRMNPGDSAAFPTPDPSLKVVDLESAREASERSIRPRKVLRRKPAVPAPEPVRAKPPRDVQTLSAMADAARRRGELTQAARLYQQIEVHPDGAGYAEEAQLRRARIQKKLGDAAGALRTLKEADTRHPAGPLGPERHMLQTELLIEAGDAPGAARAIRSVDPSRRTADALRTKVARALIDADAESACSLVDQLAEQPEDLAKRCGRKNH